MEDKAWDSQGKVRLGKRAEASFPTRTGELGTGRGSESRGQRGSGLDSRTHARAELGFRVPKSRGMRLAWLVLRKLLDTGGGGISCLRSRIGRRLSCSSKTAGDPDGSARAQGSIEVLCTTGPLFPSGPRRRLLTLVPNSWAASQTGLWSCLTPRPGAGEAQSVETRPSLSPGAARPGSKACHSRQPCGTSSAMPRHRISSAPSREWPWHRARPSGTRVEHDPSGARSVLHPGPRRAPPRPASPPRPLAPGFDPARTRGPAPHGCRATGGLPIVAPRRQLRPRASCPCVSSGHS